MKCGFPLNRGRLRRMNLGCSNGLGFIFGRMNYLLEVPLEKQAFMEELLRGLSFVKAKKISAEKAQHMNDLIDAFEEMKAIESGKKKPRSVKALIREL